MWGVWIEQGRGYSYGRRREMRWIKKEKMMVAWVGVRIEKVEHWVPEERKWRLEG